MIGTVTQVAVLSAPSLYRCRCVRCGEEWGGEKSSLLKISLCEPCDRELAKVLIAQGWRRTSLIQRTPSPALAVWQKPITVPG